MAFHAVESRGVGARFRRGQLASIWPDIVILAGASKLPHLGPHILLNASRIML